MTRKIGKSVSIRIHNDGSMTLRSTGGIDLRNVVPQFFKTEQPEADNPAPAQEGANTISGKRRVIRSEIRINGRRYGSSDLINGNDVFFRIDAADASRAHVYSVDQSVYFGVAICPELLARTETRP